MKVRTVRNCILVALGTALLMFIGISLGSYLGYTRGYRHGQKVTNAWWIGKQSRYYDSYDVDKRRRQRHLNRI